MIQLIHGECLKEMDKLIEQGITFDTIITDPPYGTTACKWDSVIPFDAMWLRLNKLIKTNGAVVLFGSEPFSSALRMSNIKNYKYDWIWEKTAANGYLNAKKMPMRAHENMSVFYKKLPVYNPQKTTGHDRKSSKTGKTYRSDCYGVEGAKPHYDSTERYPRSVQIFASDKQKTKLHPTQKPVALMEYLIKTYTNEDDIVLDFTMGSGTTGVACKNLRRNFIGIEMDDKYFKIAQERINNNEIKQEKEQVVPTGELFTSEWGLV